MKRLLSIEWQKLYNYKLARFFLILYFVLLLVVGIGLSREFTLFGKEIKLTALGFYSFPMVYNFITYAVSYLKIFLAFLVIATVVSEFTNRTFKQNLIDGLSRKEWYVSKISMIFFLCLVSTIIVAAMCLIFGFENAAKPPVSWPHQIEFLGFYFLENFFFLIFVLFLSILIRKGIFAFLILFVWKIAEIIITVLVNYALKPATPTVKFKAYHFLPLDVQGDMIMNPAQRSGLAKMLKIGTDYQFPTESVILTLVYTVVFIYLGYLVLRKRDW